VSRSTRPGTGRYGIRLGVRSSCAGDARAKVLDFGLAKVMTAERDVAHTSEGGGQDAEVVRMTRLASSCRSGARRHARPMQHDEILRADGRVEGARPQAGDRSVVEFEPSFRCEALQHA